MQLSTILITIVCATGAIADLHKYAWCADVSIGSRMVEEEKENNDATTAACGMYRRRNTGNKQWDRCPDCTPSARGDMVVCNSLGKHLGGDEWAYYCKKAGADRGKAD